MPDMDIDFMPITKETMFALGINMFRWGQLSREDKIELINMHCAETGATPLGPQFLEMPYGHGCGEPTCSGPQDHPTPDPERETLHMGPDE